MTPQLPISYGTVYPCLTTTEAPRIHTNLVLHWCHFVLRESLPTLHFGLTCVDVACCEQLTSEC